MRPMHFDYGFGCDWHFDCVLQLGRWLRCDLKTCCDCGSWSDSLNVSWHGRWEFGCGCVVWDCDFGYGCEYGFDDVGPWIGNEGQD